MARARKGGTPGGGTEPPEFLAAVDLGSNSFHLVVARIEDGEPRVVDRLRERVALAEGLRPDRSLHGDARQRALDCLGRFGQRLRELPRGAVRAVGTNTLRRARNAGPFLQHCEEALGHPVELVSGQEEARLIHLGVAHSVADEGGRRLVVDIGGGSTELIVGEAFDAVAADSVQAGCVSFTGRFFGKGEIHDSALDSAETAARLELRPLERQYRALGWDLCVGSSGTVAAIHEILRAAGWSEAGITEKGLQRLRRSLVEAGRPDRLQLPGMPEDRAPVLAAGTAILSAVFRSLRIERMEYSAGALREGVLYDLLGRIRHEDVRERTIRALQTRHGVDREQAARVERTALQLFAQMADEDPVRADEGRRFLTWAARLHEVGLSLAHSGYHKHGAYLLRNSDMPGFSQEDQAMLAALVLAHRRRATREKLEELLPRGRANRALELALPLRLSARIHRMRSDRELPPPQLTVRKPRAILMFPAEWLDEHPLTRADLLDEAQVLGAAGWELDVQ
jgi:exopolyphosphatase/guanosine-5'-triphosphate,3'-diphosphate pyrophosphatase